MQDLKTQNCKTVSKPTSNSLPVLGLFLFETFAVALVSGMIVSANLSDWYQYIEKPSFTPPSWVFSPVWSFLYTSMAIAAWRVWKQRHRRHVSTALNVYHIQLGLNFLWTAVFFGLHEPGFAFFNILALQLANIATAHEFGKIDKISGYLFIPYLSWVSFAAILNFFVWVANF